MKRLVTVVLFCAVLLGGCRGVYMTAEYSNLLDRQCAISAEAAARAEKGELSNEDMVKALQKSAESWRLFKDGRDGKESK